MLPAYAANAMPVISNHFNILKNLAVPIDFNKTLFRKPLFGHSKTIRGMVVGVLSAVLIGLIQYFLYSNTSIKEISLFDYSLNNALLVGFLLGSGALLGDLIKSFLKRRMNIPSGKPWIIFDQIDYSVGALLLTAIIFIPSLNHIITIIIISSIFAFGSNVIAYFSGIKKVWW